MRYLFVTVIAFVLDIATKFWSVIHLADGNIIQLTGFANLRLAYNYGAAFSFLSDQGGWQRWFFVAVSALVSLVLLFILLTGRYASRWSAFAYALLLGGALGNLFDRVRLGYVVDMIDLHAVGWHWPTFNIADSAIAIAVTMLLLEAFGFVGKPQLQT